MADKKYASLAVPGAQLHYEVRGAGPVLLMLTGGHGDAHTMDALANHLADQYTVVTYDRRGLSRSKIDVPPTTLRVETHSEDASRLLTALTTEPAFVFGNSIGALIGLDLTASHPAQVHTLVAHEPPHPPLLAPLDRTHAEATLQEMEITNRTTGPIAALGLLVADIGATYDDLEPGVEPPQRTGPAAANLNFFLTHDLPAVTHYKLNTAKLQAASTGIIPAGGRGSRGTWPYRCAVALANRLRTNMVELPSDHVGYMTHPRAYASALARIFSGLTASPH